ncbi:MAG: GntP family permease [Planctomycetaceae bacterium]
MFEVGGILFSLLLLMLLAWRGASVLVIAPLCVLVAVIADGGTPLLPAYTQIFMPGVGQFIARYFPLFLLGSIFGTQMQHSGAARRIALVLTDCCGASQAIPAVVLTCALLTAGGVSVFVVVFAVFPIADYLFRRANLPRRLIPAAIALGSFTFTMTALPGTVQLPNLIPMPYFGTTPWAAAEVGLVASLAILGAGLFWLRHRAVQATRRGEGYGDEAVEATASADTHQLPSTVAAFAPIAAVLAANLLLSLRILPRMDASFLAEPRFGATSLDRVIGTWSALLSLLIANSLAGLLFAGSFRRLNQWFTEGAQASLLPVFNTAVEFGYGTTIAALSGFASIRTLLGSLSPSSPLVSEAVAVNVLAGVAGSASGGLSIAMESLGETWREQGVRLGTDPELLHRVAALSCGGLDSLPHNGAVITLLLICRCTHRQSYADIAVVTLVIPLAVTALVVAYASI